MTKKSPILSARAPKKPAEAGGIIPCGVGIIRRGDRVLIAQRCEEDSFGSFWEFPGGKKNPGETFEECVAREIKEELGIVVKVQRKLMDIRKRFRRRTIWLHFYICSHVSGEPRPIECQNVQWVDLRSLSHFSFPPANEIVIARLLEGNVS